MTFEWDRQKARINRAKHDIAFEDVFGVFDDPRALTIGQIVQGEQRQVTIGLDAFGRLVVVAYTWRGDSIRIISARKATRSEAKQYESEL